MSRLTEKREKPLITKWKDVPTSYYKIKGDNTGVAISEIERLNKLGKLEDLMEKYKIENTDVLEKIIVRHDSYTMLEEELGCPLEVLSIISKNGFYYDYGYIPPYRISRIDIFNKEIMYYDEEKDYFIVKIENYKKTWWLKENREE